MEIRHSGINSIEKSLYPVDIHKPFEIGKLFGGGKTGIDFPYEKLQEIDPKFHEDIALRLIEYTTEGPADNGEIRILLENIEKFRGITDFSNVVTAIIQKGKINWVWGREWPGMSEDEMLEVLANSEFLSYNGNIIIEQSIDRSQRVTEPKEPRRFGLFKTPPKEKIMSFDEFIEILRSEKLVMQYEYREPLRMVYEILREKAKFLEFFGTELFLKWHKEDKNGAHHFEIQQFCSMYSQLIKNKCLPVEVHEMIQELISRSRNMVELTKMFLEAGRKKIIEQKEKEQGKFFEVSAGAQVWRYADISKMSLEEYFEHIQNSEESSGRLLVHVTKDTTFEYLMKDPKLLSSLALYNKGEHSEVSTILNSQSGWDTREVSPRSFTKSHALSLGVHFSFDDHLEYPDGNYACVFAAEAIFNNYAWQERKDSLDNDIVIGGLTNDYFDDSTHEIDVQRYGFFLIPESEKEKFQFNSVEHMRVFYYTGTLSDGIKQLKGILGEQRSERVKVQKTPKFRRRVTIEFEPASNSAFHAKVGTRGQLKKLQKVTKQGQNHDPTDFEMEHLGVAGVVAGRGNYFSV